MWLAIRYGALVSMTMNPMQVIEVINGTNPTKTLFQTHRVLI